MKNGRIKSTVKPFDKTMKKKNKPAALTYQTKTKVRFSEVDAMNIVWHGNYVKYLEDGREDFGNRFGISYMDIYRAGYKAPIVDMRIEYKYPATIGQTIIVETSYIDSDAAKIHFDYTISDEDGKIIVTAYTVQVFLDENDALVLNNPEFYLQWKKKWNIG